MPAVIIRAENKQKKKNKNKVKLVLYIHNDENSPYLSPSSANKDAIFLDLR